MLERTGGAVKRTSERTIGIDTESHSKETKNKKNAITTTAFPYKANNCLFVSFRKKRVIPLKKKGVSTRLIISRFGAGKKLL